MKNSKKNVAIFLRNNFTNFDYKRFSLKYLENNCNLVIYDLQNIFLKKKFILKNSININFVTIKSFKELLHSLKRDKVSQIISFVNYPKNLKELIFYLLVLRTKIDITFIDIAPVLSRKFIKEKKVFYYIKNPIRFIKTLNKYLFHKFYNAINLKFENVIVGGEADKKNKHKNFKKVIPSITIDYQLYLKSKKFPTNIYKKNLSVFLDDDLPEHSDYKLNNLDLPVKDIDKYYKNLNFFFKLFEKIFETKVIIAAHPKRKKNYFNEFEQVFFKTPELVKSSKFTFVHASTSVSFPVLAEKPIFFLTNDEIKNNWMGARVNLYAEILKSPLVNIDHVTKLDLKLLKQNYFINFEAYEKYKKKLLVNDEKISNIWENYINLINGKSF